MTSLPAPATAGARQPPPPGSWPGVRTFRSARFRTVLAATLLVGGLVVLSTMMARQVADPAGQFGIDFADYWMASERLTTEGVPYDPEMLTGPVAAQGQDRYRYPPPFAQLLVLTHGVGFGLTTWAWLVLQAAALLGALWLATGLGGARVSLERALWCAVVAVYFLPAFDTLWKGNVSGIQAFQLALVAGGGAIGGAALATALLLKLTPLAAVPAALVIRGGPRMGLITVGVAVVVVSVALSPWAWLAYGQVVTHMLVGNADFPTNLAPAAILATAGVGDGAVQITRLAVLAAGGMAVVGAVLLAKRDGGWPGAVALAIVAMLLIPASIWYHYLVLVLVPAAIAWQAAGPLGRLALIGGGAMVSAALVALPLGLLGAGVMLAASLHTLWPRTRRAITDPAR